MAAAYNHFKVQKTYLQLNIAYRGEDMFLHVTKGSIMTSRLVTSAPVSEQVGRGYWVL
jgi:hypothetical protein